MRRSLLVFLLVVAAPAFGAWEQAFREGVRAFEKKNWAVASGYMHQAIAERANDDDRVVNINGGFSVQYLPQYYLAAALAHMADCSGARSALAAAHDGVASSEKDRLLRVVDAACGQGPLPSEIAAAAERDAAASRDAQRQAEEQAVRDLAARDQAKRELVEPYQLITVPANVAFNAPKELNVGDHYVIQFVLDTHRGAEEVVRDIRERGTKITEKIGVSPRVKVYLTGAAYIVRPVTAQEQAISDTEPTEWKWEVTAKEAGRNRLFLTVDAIFENAGREVRRSVRTFDISSTAVSPRPKRKTEPAPKRRSR